MSVTVRCSQPVESEWPVFGPGQFIGRAGLVKNLLGRLARRQSLVLYGGPRLGKTSLLLHLQWFLNQSGTSPTDRLAARYLDLADVGSLEQLLGTGEDLPPVLMLDNCDQLLRGGRERNIARIPRQTSTAVVWAGGRTWRDFARGDTFPVDFHPIPLAVLLNGEARLLVSPGLTEAQAHFALSYGGTHPYVLKALRALLIADGPQADMQKIILVAMDRLAGFFRDCLRAVTDRTERDLLDYLIASAKPLNPRDVARALELRTIKAAADALVFLGLISRWNLAEGAMLHVNCRLFTEWYVTHGPHPHPSS